MYSNKLIISSDYSEIKKVREKVKQVSLEFGFFEVFLDSIELAIGELVTNIIKHGQKNISGQKSIEVCIEYTKNELKLLFNYLGDVPDKKRIEEVNRVREVEGVMDLMESGRGIYLISHLVDDIIYEKNGEKAQITMKKKL